MGDSLVRSGVSQNGQSPTMYDSPQATVAAFDQGNVAPEMEANTYTPGLQYDDSGGLNAPDVTKPNFLQSNKPQVASFEKPSLAEASATGKGLTKKGLLLNILMGAAGGAAAGYGTTGGEGFQRGAAFTNNRKLQFLNQQKQAQEQKRLEQQDARQQAQLEQNAAENKSQADLRTQQIKESEAKIGLKEKTAQEIYAEDIKNGLTPEEAKQHAYKINPPHQDANPTEASLALRAAHGDEEAIKALGFIKANKEHPKGSKAADHADRQADAEDQAGRLLDAAGGDPNKAMELFNKALATGKVDRYHLSLAPSIRNSIRGGRRVQNADPLAGLLNNNSPQ